MIRQTTFTIGFMASSAIAVFVSPVGGQSLCSENYQCPYGYFCEKGDGDCWGLGTCQRKPDYCALWVDPVCGCDGRTYSNSCFAAMWGVNVAYPGECGAICQDNSTCRAGTYCRKEPSDCAGFGYCAEIPDGCGTYWDPVCGCDGVTYSNVSCAALYGVNVAFDDPCSSCIDDADCPAGSYCDKPVGDCDGAGVCEPFPAACEPLIEPVCGCDNVTYENFCEAAIAGVTVQYLGPCMPAISDYDGDGDVDQTDFGFLQRCISGKDVTQTDPYCQPMRMDADEDVDGGDILTFLACLGGPNTLADSDCIDQP
ncbi:MAG TPA: Kazal-type serine protease inhibitor domain-containing protein [Phycisphaerae bacterium]|nr:Kazal-type serine protease inhibitor domain-containing protein [Phycisphaerae bacterium]HRR83964.1 Kazal-type serine protease inhibitor domain-containing protein [Phycisphaerae bacterium]